MATDPSVVLLQLVRQLEDVARAYGDASRAYTQEDFDRAYNALRQADRILRRVRDVHQGVMQGIP